MPYPRLLSGALYSRVPFRVWCHARCAEFFIRGLLCIRPAPYHSDGRCWSAGNGVTVLTLLFLALLVPPFAAGFLAGRYF